MNVSKKVLAVILVIAIALTIFAMAVAFNIGKLGDQLAGVGGPFATGLYKMLVGVPTYIASGGWPTLILGILVFLVLIPCSVAYITWHYDVPYKFTSATSTAPDASGFTNTMSKEPPEPERGPVGAA